MNLMTIVLVVVTLLAGLGIGYILRHFMAVSEKKNQEALAKDIISNAKEEANHIRVSARQDAKQTVREERAAFEDEMREKQRNLQGQEKNIAKKELILEQKIEEKNKEMEALKQKEAAVLEKKTEYEGEVGKYKNLQDSLSTKLAEVSGMTRDQAKEELLRSMEEEAKLDAAKMLKRIEDEANEEAEKKAKNIISTAIQRFAGEYVSERTITSVTLPNDESKGRLIGREGRNIRAFEQICGVDLLIDDTPEVVVISSFNVVRREIARMTIEKLLADGRIHPAKIEEFYERSKNEFNKLLREYGEKAQMEIGVHGIHPELLKLVGALNWRTSYTQNQYQHALETAFMCGNMAAELGLNVKQARRAGLLHDIGKVLDAAAEGSHAVVGADYAKKYGESPDIVHAIRAHHDDEKPQTILAHLVGAADALSGARPGARKAMVESYISRLTDIENIVNTFDGVSKSYAISAGREIRVIVENTKISDEQTVVLSRDIAKKIEEEMTYPGSIKITVIRETKAVGIAK